MQTGSRATATVDVKPGRVRTFMASLLSMMVVAGTVLVPPYYSIVLSKQLVGTGPSTDKHAEPAASDELGEAFMPLATTLNEAAWTKRQWVTNDGALTISPINDSQQYLPRVLVSGLDNGMVEVQLDSVSSSGNVYRGTAYCSEHQGVIDTGAVFRLLPNNTVLLELHPTSFERDVKHVAFSRVVDQGDDPGDEHRLRR